MPNLFDYLTWRGDLPLRQVPLCPVDSLVLSTLAYVHFRDLIPGDCGRSRSLGQAARAFLALPERERDRPRTRCKEDLDLLEALLQAPRFADLELTCYSDRFVPEKEMQFAAMAVLLGDGSAYLAFRGTDSTLVGWKEDFNMSFLDTVPAQWAAVDYVKRFAAAFSGPLYLGGHSKGGNLAVFAASRCPPKVRDRIRSVYNLDGPGFTAAFLTSPGYQELLPRIQTFVPQSSIIGMLLEHEEPYTVIQSRQIGILQHDPYSWSVLGGDFIRLEEVTSGSRLADRMTKNWVADLTPEQRGAFIDAVYDLLSAGDVSLARDLIHPQNLAASLRALKDTDEETRRLLGGILLRLARSTADTLREEGVPEPPSLFKKYK